MKKILFFIFLIAICGNVLAQGANTDPFQSQTSFWAQDVDVSTTWGQWLANTIKPYFDHITEILKTQKNIKFDPNISTNELLEKAKEGQTNVYKALRDLTPPEDLKAYHSSLVKQYKEITKPTPQQLFDMGAMNMASKLSGECDQEITKVFKQHGVPQETIDKFLNAFSSKQS